MPYSGALESKSVFLLSHKFNTCSVLDSPSELYHENWFKMSTLTSYSERLIAFVGKWKILSNLLNKINLQISHIND